MIVNCDIPLPDKTLKRHLTRMLDLELKSYSGYHQGHPFTIVIDDPSSSPFVREYYKQKQKQKIRILLLTQLLLGSIILLSAVTVFAYAYASML